MRTNSDEPKAVAISLFDRRVSAVAVTIVVIGAFLAALLWGLSIAMAHHPTYVANTACNGDTTALATYVGGDQRRLILISGVVINGQAYDATWSNTNADPAPNDSADGGTPVGTNGVISYNSYGGAKPAAIGDANFNFLWVGIDPGWTIFDYSNSAFVSGVSNWTGTITTFFWDGSQWQIGGNSSNTSPQVIVYEPDSPTNCATPSPSPSPTPFAEPDAVTDAEHAHHRRRAQTPTIGRVRLRRQRRARLRHRRRARLRHRRRARTVADAEPDSHAEAESDLIADAEPDSVTDAEPDAIANAESDAKPDAIADAEPDAITDAEPDPHADTEPDSHANTELQPRRRLRRS